VASENGVKGGFIDVLLQRTSEGRHVAKNRDLVIELKYFKMGQLEGQSHNTIALMDHDALQKRGGAGGAVSAPETATERGAWKAGRSSTHLSEWRKGKRG